MTAPDQPDASTGPLAGVRVVDLGQYLAGPLVGMLLADQGADVRRIEPPGGPRWDTPLNAALLRGRRTVTLDLHDDVDRVRAQKLVARADVVVENFRPGVAARLGIGSAESLARSPRLVYCSIPGFGADDPRASEVAWEGVVMAAAGAYSLQAPFSFNPDISPAPVFSPLALGSVFAAIESATAITAALIARERDGVGQHIEVPLYDALFDACGVLAMTYERNGPVVGDLGSGWYRCADGRFVTFIAGSFRHLEWFVTAADRARWIDEGLVDYSRLMTDPQAAPELRRRLVELFTQRSAWEWERVGRAAGCPIGVVRSSAEWMAEPHALESGTLVDTDDPVLGAVRVPGLAVRASAHPTASVAAPRRVAGEDHAEIVAALDGFQLPAVPDAVEASSSTTAPRPPLDGVRVLDLTRVVAAPTAAKLLGQLGADVVKIDTDPSNLQGLAPEPMFHEALNRGKRSLVLDLHAAGERELFARLASRCDVVVLNYALGAAERIGADEASVRALQPDVVYTYLNTFGRTGPWAGFRGYAELANITTGVTERTVGDAEVVSGQSAAFDLPRWIFTDYCCGVLGAFAAVLGLYERRATGRGQLVETSLVRATALEQILYLIDYAGRDIAEPRGAALGWSPLQRIYPTSDGAVFVGARASQADALCDALQVDSIDELEAGFAARPTDAACDAARRAGAGAHPVTSLREIMAPDGMAARRGLRLVDRTDRFGEIVMPGPVVRFSRTPMRPGRVPTPFGGDRDEVLEELDATDSD